MNRDNYGTDTAYPEYRHSASPAARPMPPSDDPFAAAAATRPEPEPNAAAGAPIGPPELAHTATTTDLARSDARRDAAGPGYVGEWALFCEYATATDQPALPTTVAALTGFLAALPARPATVARRVRAIAAAHRRAGYLLTRPEDGPAAPAPTSTRPLRLGGETQG